MSLLAKSPGGRRGRAEYIQGIPKSSGLGAEYDYLQGPVLVRVTGPKPKQGPRLRAALG